jgi:pilus assembly protein CpaB
MNKNIIFLISAILGLIGSALVWIYLDSLEQKYIKSSEPVQVVTARGNIPQGTVLKERMVQITEIPKQYVQPAAVLSIKGVSDKSGKSRYITILPILENEQITTTKLRPVDKELGLALVIPEGKTAVSIPVDESMNFGGHLKPGNRVNILITYDSHNKSGKPSSNTLTLLQDILILSVGRKIIGKEPIIELNQESQQTEANIVSLSVNLYEAELITLARQKTNLSFTLRAINDETVYQIPKVSLETLINPDKSVDISLIEKKDEKNTLFTETIKNIDKFVK